MMDYEIAEIKERDMFLRGLAVIATDLATKSPLNSCEIYHMRAEATGYMGGDAGHGGNATVTIDTEGFLHLTINFNSGLSLDDFYHKVSAAIKSRHTQIDIELTPGDSMSITGWGDWEQSDLALGLGRCFVKLAKILKWTKTP